MRGLGRRGQRLADFLEQLAEPGLGGVEGLAALDAGELDGAELVAALLVVADEAGDAGLESIINEMTARGAKIDRDAFGHVRLDTINPGKWFGERFAAMLGAEKVLVQKSGYFARSAPANDEDFRLIDTCVLKAVECARQGVTGLIGHDEERGDELRAIEFPRIKGGKAFDTTQPWFRELLQEIGQPLTATAKAAH